MAALTSLMAGAGLLSMGYGLFEKSQGSDQAQQGYAMQQQGARIQAQAAQQAAGISKEQAASSVLFAGQERDLNITASDQSIAAATASRDINKGIFQNQLDIETQKRNAMEVDARRQQMEIIRNQQRSRSMALTAGTAQGSQRGSGLQGGYGQIAGQTGNNLLGTQQALEEGRNVFNLNSNISGLNMQMSDLTAAYSIQQANNQTAKSNLTYGYAQANAGFQTRMADVQTMTSQGAGLIAQGGGMVGMGQSQMQSGSTFMSMGPQLFSMGTSFDKLGGSNFFSPMNNLFGGGSPTGYGSGKNFWS